MELSDALGLREVDIAASDENSYTIAIATWSDFDDTTKGIVDQVNVHGYEYGNGRRDVLYNVTKGNVYGIASTERDATGQSLAANLNLDFKWLHPTAWVYWQAVDQSGWGLLAGDENRMPSPTLASVPNNKYFVLAQYTRHVRPGMIIIDGGSDKNTIAAWNRNRSGLVLITVNYGTEQNVKYDLSQIYTKSCPTKARRWTTNFDGSKQYERARCSNFKEDLEVFMESNQVTTLDMQL